MFQEFLFLVVLVKEELKGKIAAINFSRKHKIPFLGICFGMQMAIIEFARNALNIKNATSTEFGYSGTSCWFNE